jgi:hypothetical protein
VLGLSAVSVPVVNVWIMSVRVYEGLMAVRMRVWFSGRIARNVNVLVMLIVHVKVLVRQRLVTMLVRMPLADVQPHA